MNFALRTTILLVLCLVFSSCLISAEKKKKERYKADELTPVRIGGLGGLYGYINTKGKMCIDPQFKGAYYFSDGLALVKDGENSTWGFINLSAEFVIGNGQPAPGDSFHAFSEGLAAFNKDGKYGFMDTTGKVVIEPQFDHVEKFSEGFAVVCGPKNKYGFINTKGEYLVEPAYNEALAFSDGLAAVNLAGIRGNWGYINTKGKMVIEPQFHRSMSFRKGLARAMPKEGGGFGLINKKGKYIISYKESTQKQKMRNMPVEFMTKTWYSTADCDSESGLAPYGDGSQWYLINSKGKKMKVPFLCTYINHFSDGMAVFRAQTGGQGYVNTKGKIAIKPKFEEAQPFRNGLAWVLTKDGQEVLVNKRGKVVFKKEQKK